MRRIHIGDYVKVDPAPGDRKSRYLRGHIGQVEQVVSPKAVGISVASMGDPRALHWVHADSLRPTTVYVRNAGLVSLKLSDTALSVFETDVLEVAQDPEVFGVWDEEALAYQALARAIDWKKSVLVVPEDANSKRMIVDLLVELANSYDAMLESGKSYNAAFDSRARRVLSDLSLKVARA